MNELTHNTWRSMLYVPAHVERFVSKAAGRGADALILDLEDSVPQNQKAEARSGAAAAIPGIAQAGVAALVRINRPLALAVRDVEAVICHSLSALVITKVDGASHLRLLDELVSELETARGLIPGRIRFALIIEDARAWLRMPEIFSASPRNVAALLGGEDFARDCGMAPDGDALAHPKQQLVMCARAAGLRPLGVIGSVAGMNDDDAYRAMLARSRRFGFAGATCIHPGQVASLNAAFSPSRDDIDWATRALAAYNHGLEKGLGAVRLDGHMIDKPVADRARALLMQGSLTG